MSGGYEKYPWKSLGHHQLSLSKLSGYHFEWYPDHKPFHQFLHKWESNGEKLFKGKKKV
jgi:hypothetical protein